MGALQKVTAALAGAGSVRKGTNWNCPAHDDRTQSLQVTPHPGKIGVHCHAGCITEDVMTALDLGMPDLFDDELKEVARYPYVNRDGELLFNKIRFQPKSFTIDRRLTGIERPLYNLPAVVEAVADGGTVWIVNGEKSADKLREWNITATCTFNGENSWNPEYGKILEGADIVIVADRDDTGVKHALDIQADLRDKARSIRIVQSRTEGDHDDVVDHLDAGFTLDELVPFRAENAISLRYRRVDWHEAFGRGSDIDWLLPPILEAGTINALFGKPGAGKSLITLDWAVQIVREGRKVMYVDEEQRIQDTVERLRDFGCTPGELDNLVMYNFAGLPPLDTPEGGQHLEALAEVNEPSLVVLDTTTRMVEGDENAATTWLQLYRNSLVPLKRRNICVLRLDHPGKDELRGQRGSSAKGGDVDTIFRLTFEPSGIVVLDREKSRSGHHEQTLTYKRLRDPLRHELIALGGSELLPLLRTLSRKADEFGVPRHAGRPALRDMFTAHNVRCSTSMLALVVKYRKELEKEEYDFETLELAQAEPGCPF